MIRALRATKKENHSHNPWFWWAAASHRRYRNKNQKLALFQRTNIG